MVHGGIRNDPTIFFGRTFRHRTSRSHEPLHSTLHDDSNPSFLSRTLTCDDQFTTNSCFWALSSGCVCKSNGCLPQVSPPCPLACQSRTPRCIANEMICFSRSQILIDLLSARVLQLYVLTPITTLQGANLALHAMTHAAAGLKRCSTHIQVVFPPSAQQVLSISAFAYVDPQHRSSMVESNSCRILISTRSFDFPLWWRALTL